MILIDSHAHLNFENFHEDFSEVIERAHNSDVKYIINVGIDSESILSSIDLAEKYDFIYAAVGIHPHNADTYSPDEIELVEKYISHPKVVALGEIGLDFFRKYADHDNQRKLFREMIDIGMQAGKPLIIHTRAALEETLKILREKNAGSNGGVFHCFSGDVNFAREVIKFGFYVSFAGNLTYDKSSLPETAEAIPIERTLVETDCPFLTPAPRRGKRCEPADVRFTAEKLAEIKQLSLADIARITTLNVYNLFGVGPKPERTIVYPIRNSLYVNLTNRCSCDCTFCPRLRNPVVKGHSLKLDVEPDYDEAVRAVESFPNTFDELVFCGFGEPTMRFDLMLKLAKKFRSRFKKLRLDTNGHGNLINGRDITGEIASIFDVVSVSLNTSDPGEYLKLNRPEFGEKAYEAVKEFMKSCKAKGLDVIASIVGFPGADEKGAEKLAEESGVNFKIRKYNDLG